MCALFCGLFFSVQSAEAGTLVRPPNNLGLIGYWSMNEGTSTIATDFSGTGMHGTLTNMALASTTSGWAPGKQGNALGFDGSNDYVETPTQSISGSITVSAWVHSSNFNHNGFVIGKNPVNTQWELFFETPSTLKWRGGANENTTVCSIPTNNQWHHVVGKQTGTTGTLYIDGVVCDTGTLTAIGNGGGTIDIGRFSSGYYFNGKIDEVRLYNRALTDAQVTALYNSGASSFRDSHTLTDGTTLENGVVGHWTFDGKDMVPNVRDVSGNANHGVLFSDAGTFWSTGTTSVAGRLGQALSWTVSNVGGVNVLSAATLDNIEDQGGGGVTGSAWIYRDTGGAVLSSEVDCHLDAGTGRWRFFANGSGGLDFCKQFATTNLRVISGNSFIPAQTWTHVAYTWDGSSAALSVHFYVNGIEVTSYITQTDGSGAKESDAANNKEIGNGVFSGQDDYRGYMDDVRIYNRILSLTEIKQLYNLAQGKTNASSTAMSQGTSLKDGLLGLWTFDGPDITTSILDRSGQGNNGYFIGAATSSAKTIGKLGQALTFDGIDDYTITTRSGTSLTQLAVSFWVNPRGNDGTQRGMFQWADNLSDNAPFILVTRDTTNEVRLYVDGGYRVSNVVIPSNAWSHVAAILDTANLWTFYIDGVSVGTYQDDATHTYQSSATSVYVGNGFNAYFPGSFDDVRVYNRTLSASEVKQLYLMGN